MQLLPLAKDPFVAPADRDMRPSERRLFVQTHRTCVFGYGRASDGPAMSVVYYVPADNDYRCALRAAGDALTPWMVGDNYQADVVGAERAGIPAILVRSEYAEARRSAKGLVEAAAIISSSRDQ